MQIGTAADWASAIATLFASCVALYFGLRKTPTLRVHAQPRNISTLSTNSLDLYICNLAPHILLIRDVQVQISLMFVPRKSFILPKDWYSPAKLPTSIVAGSVALIQINPDPVIGEDIFNWIKKIRDKHWYEFWKSPAFQRISFLVDLEDGYTYEHVLKRETNRRMRTALLMDKFG